MSGERRPIRRDGATRGGAGRAARAELVRRIVLSRFLELPIPALVRAVRDAEALVARHPGLSRPGGPLRRVTAGRARGAWPEPTCGRVRLRRGVPELALRPEVALAYEGDHAALRAYAARLHPAEAAALSRAFWVLLLATARSRMTRALGEVLVETQRAFLVSGRDRDLVPLSAREAVRRARHAGGTSLDEGRASRLLRSSLVVLPTGASRPLGALCPTTRLVLSAQVRAALAEERALREAGTLAHPWSDAELARWLGRTRGLRVSRRLVAYCRKRIGAPGARARAKHGAYLAATASFSALYPLERATVAQRAPAAPGVYELRICGARGARRAHGDAVIYIGHGQDLRARLLDHAWGTVRNQGLLRHVRAARVEFRFRVERRDPRRAEAELYRRFKETFGRPPECNRVSP